jgi:hypothetical protein
MRESGRLYQYILSLALGPHPQRELTLMPRLGCAGLGSA